jgi:hypothetical protein
VDLVDLFGAGRLAVGLGAVVLAGLTAGFLGLGGGRALGKGGGLALAGTGRRVELAAEAVVLSLQVMNLALKGLAVGTSDRFHAGIIHGEMTRSAADGRQGAVPSKLRLPIKSSMDEVAVVVR